MSSINSIVINIIPIIKEKLKFSLKKCVSYIFKVSIVFLLIIIKGLYINNLRLYFIILPTNFNTSTLDLFTFLLKCR